jgi:hypothetical protein
MTNDNDVFLKVVDQLSKITAVNTRISPISYDTEVYADLRIYGDDLYELAAWMHKEFEIQPVHGDDLFAYAPTEMPFFRVREFINELVGRRRRSFRSLKVSDLLSVIENKRWPVVASNPFRL